MAIKYLCKYKMEASIMNKCYSEITHTSATFSHSFHPPGQGESEFILQPSQWWVAEISHLSLMSLTLRPIPVSIWQETGEILKSGSTKLRKRFFSWDYTDLIKEWEIAPHGCAVHWGYPRVGGEHLFGLPPICESTSVTRKMC